MKSFAVLGDFVSLLNTCIRGGGLDDGRRILEGKANYLQARIQDVEGAFFSASIHLGKKRKRDSNMDDLISWVTKGRELVQESKSLLGHEVEPCSNKNIEVKEQTISSSQTWAKLVNVLSLIETLSVHEKEADMLFKRAMPSARDLDHGNLIPVRALFGQVALDAMEKLQILLRGDEIGRIAILGIEGIGKTFLMKHLHNSVVKWVDRFDYVFWVTTPDEFSIERLQDAVAAAVKCELSAEDDVDVRSKKLSDTFEGLGSFVIFLDDVPEAYFSLAQVGIPVPAVGSKSKLVFTTRSSFVPEILECHETLNFNPLSDEQARILFLNESSFNRSAGLRESIPFLLANKCSGVPGKIVGLATRMRGIDDPREWSNTLDKLRKNGTLT